MRGWGLGVKLWLDIRKELDQKCPILRRLHILTNGNALTDVPNTEGVISRVVLALSHQVLAIPVRFQHLLCLFSTDVAMKPPTHTYKD